MPAGTYYQSIKDLLQTKICSQRPPPYNFDHEYESVRSSSPSLYEAELYLWAKYFVPNGCDPRTTFPGIIKDVSEKEHEAALGLLALHNRTPRPDPYCIKLPPGYVLNKQKDILDAHQDSSKYPIQKQHPQASPEDLRAAQILMSARNASHPAFPTTMIPSVGKPDNNTVLRDMAAGNEGGGKSNASQGLVYDVQPSFRRQFSESLRYHAAQSEHTESSERPERSAFIQDYNTFLQVPQVALTQMLVEDRLDQDLPSDAKLEAATNSSPKMIQLHSHPARAGAGSATEATEALRRAYLLDVGSTEEDTDAIQRMENEGRHSHPPAGERPRTQQPLKDSTSSSQSTAMVTEKSAYAPRTRIGVTCSESVKKRGGNGTRSTDTILSSTIPNKKVKHSRQVSDDNVPKSTPNEKHERSVNKLGYPPISVSKARKEFGSTIRRDFSADHSSDSPFSSSSLSPPRSWGATKEPVEEGKACETDSESAHGSFLSSNSIAADLSASVSSAETNKLDGDANMDVFGSIELRSEAGNGDIDSEYVLDDDTETYMDEPIEFPSSDKDDEDYTDSDPSPKNKSRTRGIIIDDSEFDEDSLRKSTQRKSQHYKKSVEKQKSILDKPRKQNTWSQPLTVDKCDSEERALLAKPKKLVINHLLYPNTDESSDSKIDSKAMVKPQQLSKDRFKKEHLKPTKNESESDDNDVKYIPTSSPLKCNNKGTEKISSSPSTPFRQIPQTIKADSPSKSLSSSPKKRKGTFFCSNCNAGFVILQKGDDEQNYLKEFRRGGKLVFCPECKPFAATKKDTEQLRAKALEGLQLWDDFKRVDGQDGGRRRTRGSTGTGSMGT